VIQHRLPDRHLSDLVRQSTFRTRGRHAGVWLAPVAEQKDSAMHWSAYDIFFVISGGYLVFEMVKSSQRRSMIRPLLIRPSLPAIALVAAALGGALTLTSCGSDPLAITCGSYLRKSEQQQLDLAARWGSPDRDHPSRIAEFASGEYRKDLLHYCPGHRNSRLSELELTLVPGVR
jgi:hypothetical protein